jgi:predicted AAA+ superfamily ATPase
MESFYKAHQYLLEHIDTLLRRKLLDDIDWNDRLICIIGSRGVGKTSLLFQYAREKFSPADKECLYINMNDFYFTVKPLRDFANEFRMKGGKVLLIDQTFKYPGWADDLAFCYDNYPDLQIVFTCLPIINPEGEISHLKDKMVCYNLSGFSFREFLELQTGCSFEAYTLENILEHHAEIAQEITSQVKPLAFIDDYLHYGFYPFYLEKHNFQEALLNIMNLTLEVDILISSQVVQNYLSKIKKLFYLLSLYGRGTPNISQLSADIEISRATVMNYIKYLDDACLINPLYSTSNKFSKKPAQLYMDNTNLLYTILRTNIDEQLLKETFFYNQVHKFHTVNLDMKNTQFLVDGCYHFSIGSRIRGKFNSDCYYAISGIEAGERRVIPLWLFGFLY